jgi:ABC-type sugar transport system ATPase subunit
VKDVLEKNDTKFKVGIRPENVEISTTKREEWLRFNSDFVEFQGIKDVVTLRKGGILINVVVPSEKFKISKGDDVWVHFLENKIKIYNSKDILII